MVVWVWRKRLDNGVLRLKLNERLVLVGKVWGLEEIVLRVLVIADVRVFEIAIDESQE